MELVDTLKAILYEGRPPPDITEENLGATAKEIADLQQEESEVTTHMVELRNRLAEMEKLRDTARRYDGQLAMQRERLRISEWLAGLQDKGKECPICGAQMTAAHERLQQLLYALKDIEASTGQYRSVPAAFDREYQRVQGEVRTVTEKLAGTRHRIDALSRGSDEARQQQEIASNSARFLGRLEQALNQYERVEDGEVAGEVETLRERIRSLEDSVRESEVEKRKQNALKRVATFAQKLMPRLDAERPDDPLAFSVPDLTVKVTGKGSREDYLWEIGSASNWLSYHVAITLAFQEFFLSQSNSPVPSFLVFDQPSQAYFPQRLLGKGSKAGDEEGIEWKDEDVEAVRKVFGVFSDAVKAANGGLQVIVLDHANENVWGSVQPLHRVADWRGGEKLVPAAWLE